MTDFSPLDSALYESTPEKIAASLHYLRKADAVIAALMPLFAYTQAPPAAVMEDGDLEIRNPYRPSESWHFKAPPAAVPAGYALVPVEPTTAMKCRAVEAWEGPAVYKSMFARGLADLEDKAADCWTAMLAAALAAKGETP